jgi:membrane associated rhomboid family serine protease
MTSTPVGMRCPECARDRTKVRNIGGAPGRADAPATFALIAICVAAFVAELAGGGGFGRLGGGSVITEGGLYGPAVAEGEPYRIVTSAFLHAGILHLGLNMFVLYILGTLLEPAIGTARFAALYAVSILAGSFGALLLDPLELTVGASGGVFGLMAGGFLIARDRGFDELASQIGFFVLINLLFTFTFSGTAVAATSGGLTSAAPPARVTFAPERTRTPNAKAVEIGVMILLCGIAVAGALVAAEASL